jgi:hypothetical protein
MRFAQLGSAVAQYAATGDWAKAVVSLSATMSRPVSWSNC